MKKLFVYGFICLFVYFSIPPVFAIPGQLNNDLFAPPTATCMCDDEPLNTCNSLLKACQLQKSDLERENSKLTGSLEEEKKNSLILKVILGGVFVCSAGIIIFLKVNQPHGGRPFSEQQVERIG